MRGPFHFKQKKSFLEYLKKPSKNEIINSRPISNVQIQFSVLKINKDFFMLMTLVLIVRRVPKKMNVKILAEHGTQIYWSLSFLFVSFFPQQKVFLSLTDITTMNVKR